MSRNWKKLTTVNYFALIKTLLVDWRVYTWEHCESVKQCARIVWASLKSSLEVARYDCLPQRFSLTFQPPLFSVKIKKKSNFQLVCEPLFF